MSMSRMFLVVLIFISQLSLASEIPILDLEKAPNQVNYNLYESGCSGLKVLIPADHRIEVQNVGAAQCTLSQLPQIIDGYDGYGMSLTTVIEEDSLEGCKIRLVDSRSALTTKVVTLTCNPT